jgi:hypothetical protein
MTNTDVFQNEAMFKQSTATEIAQLFGLHMYMGINKLPRLHLNWSPLMRLEKFCRSTVMTLKRFCQLRNNLHITNNLQRPSECGTNFTKCVFCWILFIVDAKSLK